MHPAGRRLFLSVDADRGKRRSLRYQLREAVRSPNLLAKAQRSATAS